MCIFFKFICIFFFADTYHLNTDEICLETSVRGQPRPEIEWLKDSVTIDKENPKYQQIVHIDGTLEFIINFPHPNDGGKFTCKATNSAGESQISHIVAFEGKEAHITDNRHRVYHADHTRLERAKSIIYFK